MSTAKERATPKYKAYMKEYLRKYMRGYSALQLRKLRAERGNACEDCGGAGKHFAHKAPTKLHGRGRGQYCRVRDIKHNPTCYLLLCVECHRRRDLAAGTWCNPTNYARPHGLKG